jgi:hypothetical protein
LSSIGAEITHKESPVNALLIFTSILAAIVLLVMIGRHSSRRKFAKEKNPYKRPIWNVLARSPDPLSCPQINMRLERLEKLVPISDSELYDILDEMVVEGTLERVDQPVEAAGAVMRSTRYRVKDGSSPPPPPSEESEETTVEAKRGIAA